MIWPRRTMLWGLYPIVSSCDLNDCTIDHDELFSIARPIILVDVPSHEFL
jgi:hypothetical protein